jgi:DNA modification methylase
VANFDTSKIEGEDYTLGEQVQYTDIWANDNYLQFMYERLLMLKELLSDDGAIYLHCDWKKVHHLRCLLDEVFGLDNFRNEIIWAYPGREMHIEHKFNAKHDNILFVAKSDAHRVNMSAVSKRYDAKERIKSLRRKIHKDDDGREWVWETRGQSAGQEPYKRYIDEIIGPGHALNDIWDDLQFLRGNDPKRTGYPTQKPISLAERIVKASSSDGDIILDCFIGSGTLAEASQRLGRRWIGCDINKGAIQTTAKRLQSVIQQQAEAAADPQQGSLEETDQAPVRPAQLSFTTWRVNDYDLQIQHNEAVALACEHIGITRSRTDGFFDGHLGNKLVKIIPFNHPLSPLDLEDIDAELKRRPEEERDVTVVALGMELAARTGWIRSQPQSPDQPLSRHRTAHRQQVTAASSSTSHCGSQCLGIKRKHEQLHHQSRGCVLANHRAATQHGIRRLPRPHRRLARCGRLHPDRHRLRRRSLQRRPVRYPRGRPIWSQGEYTLPPQTRAARSRSRSSTCSAKS